MSGGVLSNTIGRGCRPPNCSLHSLIGFGIVSTGYVSSTVGDVEVTQTEVFSPVNGSGFFLSGDAGRRKR